MKKKENIVRKRSITKKISDIKAKEVLDLLARKGIIEFVDGDNKRVKVLGTIPTVEEFKAMKAADEQERFSYTIGGLISDAFSEAEELKDELQNWYDNLPENFQNGSKGDTLQDAISYFDSLSQPDVPEFIENLKTIYHPPKHRRHVSRADRCSEAIDKLETAKSELEAYIEEHDDGKDETADKNDEAQNLADELDNAISELQSVEFPSMFG